MTNKLCSGGELDAAGTAVVRTFHYGSGLLLLFLVILIALPCCVRG